jgi:hypothetical protein
MGSALKFLTRYAQEGDEFLDSFLHLRNISLGKSSTTMMRCKK